MAISVPSLTILKPAAGEVGLIQGIVPDSVNEWYFSQACDKLKLDYIYQYSLGMVGVRGSQWIDFVVYLAGFRAACNIQGKYWHTTRTADEDRMKHQIQEHIFGKQNVFDFSEEETASVEIAITSIRKKLL